MIQRKLHMLAKSHRPFLLLVLSYLLITGTLTVYFPPFTGPNEVLHYEYVALMRQTGKLPDLATSFRPDERHQPPVYYSVATFLALPLTAPPLDDQFAVNPHFATTYQGNLNPYVDVPPAALSVVWAGRIASLLFGLLALLALYGAAQLTLPRTESLLVAAVMAFQPTFLQLSGIVNNDLAVTAVSTLLVAYTTYLIVHQKIGRPFLLWGIIMALAILTKASAIFLLLLLPLLFWSIWQQQRALWPVVKSGLWTMVSFIPIYGSWLLFNHIRSGDTLGLAPSVPIGALFTLRPADFLLTIPYLPELFRSFWLDWSPGIIGYGPDWLYGIAAFFLLAALLGWFWPSGRLAQPTLITTIHLFWVLSLGAAFVAVKTLMIRDVGFLVPEGRWLLPAWPSLAWLVGVGWAKWWPVAKRHIVCNGTTAVFPVSALLLVTILMPHLYPQATHLTSHEQIPANATPVQLLYNEQIELVALEADNLTIGQPSPITLYWHSQQPSQHTYTVLAQLLWLHENGWRKIEEQSSFPGSGLTPTNRWQRDGRYKDKMILQPDAVLDGPTEVVLAIWLLNGGQATTQKHGQPVEWPFVAKLTVRPADPLSLPDQLLPAAVDFDNQFRLMGLETAVSGEVTLWWQAQQPVAGDFTIFVHLLDAQGQLIAQSDQRPAAGSSPTHRWQPGDVIRDSHQLPPLPDGGFLYIGAYETATGQRLPLAQHNMPQLDNMWRYDLNHAGP